MPISEYGVCVCVFGFNFKLRPLLCIYIYLILYNFFKVSHVISILSIEGITHLPHIGRCVISTSFMKSMHLIIFHISLLKSMQLLDNS
jgi:hypothetical protein